MIIETQQDWNGVLAGCGCCEMPLCPVPTKECESKTGQATSADTDYSDAMAAWNAADPLTRGPEPEMPVGYDEVSHGSWAPFTQPQGAPEDDIPTLYQEFSNPAETYSGFEGWYYSNLGLNGPVAGSSLADPGRSCVWISYSYLDGEKTESSFYGFGFWWDDGAGDAGSSGSVQGSVEGRSIPHTGDWVAQENECSATATKLTPANSVSGMGNATGTYGTPRAVPAGTPAEWLFDEEPGTTWAVGFTRTVGELGLGSGVGKDAVIARAISKIPEGWEGAVGGCSSSSIVLWPTIGEMFSGGDSQANPPLLASWPSCESGLLPLEAIGLATITKSRFRWVIPDTFAGSYFKRSWDILNEPDGWDAENPTVFRSLEEGGTWIWEGPGDPLDPESWKSPWYEIPPPATPGTRRPVNARSECYRSTKFGVKPQVDGEGVEIEPPPAPPPP